MKHVSQKYLHQSPVDGGSVQRLQAANNSIEEDAHLPSLKDPNRNWKDASYQGTILDIETVPRFTQKKNRFVRKRHITPVQPQQ